MTSTIALPWPPSILTPNSRTHWSGRHRAAKAYAKAVGNEALAQGLRRMDASSAVVAITLHQPTGRVARDADNAIAAFKAGQDAIAAVIGIDDGKWQATYAFGHPVKGGAVVLEITCRNETGRGGGDTPARP